MVNDVLVGRAQFGDQPGRLQERAAGCLSNPKSVRPEPVEGRSARVPLGATRKNAHGPPGPLIFMAKQNGAE
jgi:hypothetical protein